MDKPIEHYINQIFDRVTSGELAKQANAIVVRIAALKQLYPTLDDVPIETLAMLVADYHELVSIRAQQKDATEGALTDAVAAVRRKGLLK